MGMKGNEKSYSESKAKKSAPIQRKAAQAKQSKPKKDITKITRPKATSKPKAASGTVAKKVGGGKVRSVEQTTPQAKGRIRGENTAPIGKGPRQTY